MQILTLKTAVLLASVATALCALSTSSSAQVPSPEKIKQLEQLARDLAGRSDGCVALNQPALVRARQASKAGVTSRLTYIRTGISSKLSPGDRRVLDQAAARPGANFAGMSLWINNREKSAVYVLATDALQKSGRQGTKTIGLLGGALNSLYLYEETIALLQAAVNEKRADAAVLHNLGVAYGALGDRQTAMGYLTEARSRAPHLGEIVGALGVLLRCEGKGEEAKAALRLAQALRWSGHDARQLEALREELGDSSSEPPVPAPGEPTSVNRVENGDDSEDGGDQESERDSDSERDSEVSEESGSDGSGSDSGPSKASKGFGPKAAPFTLPRFPASADNLIANQRLWQQLWSESASRYRGLAEQLRRERLAMPETDPVVGEGEAYDLLIEDQLVSLSNYYSERLSYETGGTGVGSGSSYDDRMTRVNEASQKAARLRAQASPGLYESTHPRHAEHCSAWRGDASGFFMQYKTLASLGSQSQIVVDYLTRAMAWANMTSDPQVRKKRQLEVLENYYLFVTQLHGVPMKAAGSWSSGWAVGYATCRPEGNNTYVSEKPPPPEKPSPPDDKPCPKLGAEFGRGAASASVEITCGKVKFAVDALIFRTAVEQNMKDKSGEIFLGLSVAPSAGFTVAGVSRFVEAEFEAGFYTSFDSSGRVSDFGVVERSSLSNGTEASVGAASVRVSRELKSTESRTSFDESFVSLFTGDSALTTSPPAGASGSLAPRGGSTGR